MVRLVLETEGYEVVEAAHGEAAIDIIQPGFLPDVVTTDLMMPSLGGLDLIERLRSEPHTATIPIVVISGRHEVARSLQTSGLVDAVVEKPFAADTVAQCVRNLVSGAIASRDDRVGHGAALTSRLAAG